MTNNHSRAVIKILLTTCILTFGIAHAELDATSQHEFAKFTEDNLFRVTIKSKLKPIVINTMHTWHVHIEDKNENSVVNAEIIVTGGMPEHDHGLPTRPQITQNFGNGCYLLEGMKFHLGGWWTITFTITEENVSDMVTFDLNL